MGALVLTDQCKRKDWEPVRVFQKLNSNLEDWASGKGRAVVRDGFEVLAFFEVATQAATQGRFEVAEEMLQRARVWGLESFFKKFN